MNALRTINRRRTQAALLAIVVWAARAALATGTWSDTGASTFLGSASGAYAPWTIANTAAGCAPLIPGCNQAQTLGTYLPGYFNHNYGAEVRMGCPYSFFGCRVDGVGETFTVVDGLGSNRLTVRWNASAVAYYTSECWPPPPALVYDVNGSATLATTVAIQVNTVPPGQPVTIYYAWWSLIHCSPRPEAAVEDDATAQVSLQVLGTELIPARFRNLAGIHAVVLLPPPTAPGGAIYARGGDIITIQINAGVAANIAQPPQTFTPVYDEARSEYTGELILSIDAPVTILNPATAPGGFASFSVDIGSDAEMSDPNPNGNEVFDPGDLYPWNGPLLPSGGASGPRDDVEIFLTDYWPVAPDGPPPSTGAETCAGKSPAQIQGILGARFDLDGTDQLDFSLVGLIDPNQPLLTPLPQFDSNCVYNAEHLAVSFNDDGASHYAGPGCDVPVGSLSPTGHTYGTGRERDELVGVEVDVAWPQGPAGPPAVVNGTYPIMDEAGLHPNLAPDPDGQERDDDDIDALDIGVGACTVWYFSADHEATGIAPFPPPQLLDPGAIYQVLGPPSYGAQKVIDPQIHLGVLPGTDVDAFEFAWLAPCDTCPTALALLFSVAPDDYLTPAVDESGGLDAQMIYYSFFDGNSYPLLDQPLNDDVDAIATTPMPFLPQSCTSGGMVTWSDDFENYPLGGGIAGLGGWETWANDPTVDGLISPQFALSGVQSLQVGPTTDVVHQFGATGGRWEIDGRVYVPYGTTGQSYFILLNDYNSTGSLPPEAWSVQIKIDADNLAVQDDFGGPSVPLYTDAWITIHVEIDLVNDDAWIYFDGKLLNRRQWTRGVGGALRLAAVDLYTPNSMIYFDDFVLTGIDDCNGNGVDDLCDLATGSSLDCNQNGQPDECDIASGVSRDVNGNGVPDECEVCRGDLNCDGQVDFGDINPFVLRLSNPAGYAAQYPGCPNGNGDINGDGSVDFGDINPFVTLLSTSPLPILCP